MNGAAIVGIGHTEFSKASERSELRLASEAVLAALGDAGIGPGEVDGLVTLTADTSSEIALARAVGVGDLTFFSRIHYGGGGACALVQQACLAVESGLAEVVVAYRALNERSGRRFGLPNTGQEGRAYSEDVDRSWTSPFGLFTPAAQVAMVAQRYMHEFGASSEDFGRVTVASRRHAATNPYAWFYGEPITLEDHQRSRWIVEPLRLLDCCQESDGGAAVVITTRSRAASLPHRPAVVEAAAQGSAAGQYAMTSYYRDRVTELPEMGLVARQLYRGAEIGPEDIQTAVLYDHFTPLVLPQLEEFGFCARGEAKDFIADGAIEIDGRLPVNTHGGQIGEAYIHGVNGIIEAVRQIRGSAWNQVDGLRHVLVTAGSGVPTSGLILGNEA